VKQWRTEVARKLVLGYQKSATEAATPNNKEEVIL